MSNYLMSAPTTKKTPQSKVILGREREMTRNDAGAFAFKADCWKRLERWLITGSESGSYYVSEQDLTAKNVDNVRTAITEDGPRAVQMIVDISVGGRAPKNDAALYALALAASNVNEKTRALALAALPKVARTGTHLFTFAAFIDGMRGWGPALKRAVSDWYADKTPDSLAFQLVKYQQRNGWSHKDLFKLCHPKFNTALARWVIGADYGERQVVRLSKMAGRKEALRTDKYSLPKETDLPAIIAAFEQAKTADKATTIRLIREYGLSREMIATEHQKSPEVWEALLEKMPPSAMVRTLGRMSAYGLLVPFSDACKTVCDRLRDGELLRKKRVHPIAFLQALLTYQSGHGEKGSLTWTPVPQVIDALNDAFYSAFSQVESTGKRFYLGIDVSGSMTTGTVAGMSNLTPNMGAAAMAMLIARTEPHHFIGGFSHRIVDLGISKSDRLDAAMRKCQMDFGGTDASLIMMDAIKKKYAVDAFVVVSDGESWAGSRHASQAIQEYRNASAIDAKLICVNMIANHTRITDPTDAGSLDVVGFVASVPTVINGFMGSTAVHAGEDE